MAELVRSLRRDRRPSISDLRVSGLVMSVLYETQCRRCGSAGVAYASPNAAGRPVANSSANAHNYRHAAAMDAIGPEFATLSPAARLASSQDALSRQQVDYEQRLAQLQRALDDSKSERTNLTEQLAHSV